MFKVECTNGHYFDADRFPRCPICGAEADHAVQVNHTRAAAELPKTEPLLTEEIPQAAPEKAGREARRVDELAPTEKLRPEDEERLSMVAKRYQESMASADRAGEEPEPDDNQDSDAAEDAAETAPASDTAEQVISQAPPAENVPSESESHSEAAPLADAVKATASTEISALPKTVAYYDFEEVIPPVGWIVCVKGRYLGQAFECKAGRNKIGRGESMEINLKEERSINRDVHASIIYEPIQRQFFIQAGAGDGLTYLNGSLVFSHEELHPYDKLSVGKLEFVFLPLCGDRFTWDEYMTEE